MTGDSRTLFQRISSTISSAFSEVQDLLVGAEGRQISVSGGVLIMNDIDEPPDEHFYLG